ncbi:MAG: Gfo/Idh/MocA family oxidoreductase [Verrucomicrobiota bacterium]|nr:Gfo/Idh/MocA family oxidoreductase [Verrucomicrobiota bacterium]
MQRELEPGRLSLGFIGGSVHSGIGYAHSCACMMDKRWSLDAGCFSREWKTNVKTARAYGVPSPRVYPRWQEMILNEKDQMDAVVVLAPTPTHCEIVTGCLMEGMPVICEKALGGNSAEVRQIQQAQKARNGFLVITYNYSGYPMVRELRSLVRKGVLGRILHFQVEMPQEGFRRVDAQGNKLAPQAWRLLDGRIPMVYLDLAAHLHHLVHYLTGSRPIEVVAEQARYGAFDVIDNVTCLCRYSDDIRGQMWFSKSALGHRNGLRLRIYGSEASAEWLQCCPEDLLLCFADGRRQVVDRASSAVDVAAMSRYGRFKAGHPAGFIEAFANLYSDIADCRQQHKAKGRWESEEVFGCELAAEGIELFEAMVASFRSRAWQAVGSPKA